MKLPVYKNFEEKGQHFNLFYINTIEEFKDFFQNQQDRPGIYRGINNSSYKIYSSLQRQIIEKNLKNFKIEKYISEVRNKPILKSYFKTFNIVPSKLSIWSYLQHYGAPTPLVDFTNDILSALYFATEKFDATNFISSKGINDYFSIFFIKSEDLEIISIDKVFESFREYKRLSEKIFHSYPPEKDFDYDTLLSHFDEMFDINVLEIFLLNHNEEFIEIFNCYNNIRILAQDGLFIHNLYNEVPLEEALKKFFIEATKFQHSPWDEIDTPEAQQINAEYELTLEKNKGWQSRLKKNIISSYEIKKDLIPEIINIINKERKDIYPNEEDLVWEIFTSTCK